MNQNIYQAGYNAFLERMGKNICPYSAGTKEYRTWIAGWYGAEFLENETKQS